MLIVVIINREMHTKIKIGIVVLFIVEVIFLGVYFLRNANFQLLNPQGLIAHQQKEIFLTAIVLMLVIVAPVYITTFIVAYKYRSGNRKAKRENATYHNKFLEASFWVGPIIIVTVLSFMVWDKTHKLDPYKPLISTVPPITVQVVALQWKWLFLYPREQIATVNFVQFPEKTPIIFELTADAPMSSFWVPSLSGQIYAMTGMVTKLHVMADATGDYPGSAAEINGKGFSGMKFTARSSTKEDFDKWVQQAKSSPYVLDEKEYERLSSPSEDTPVSFYGSYGNNLYNRIISKFSAPVKGM